VASFARHLLTGPEDRPRMLFLTPPPEVAPHSSLVHMFETVRREFGGPLSMNRTPIAAGLSPLHLPGGEIGADSRRLLQFKETTCQSVGESLSPFTGKPKDAGAWDLDFEATIAALHEGAEAGQPLVVLGTAFSLVHLRDHLTGRNERLSLPPGSRVMETGGYKGRARVVAKAELHALITERLGVPASHIVCEYGMSELSSQAYETEVSSSAFRVPSSRGAASGATRLFRFPPWVRAQIISPESGREVAEGETGLIRVFDLANVWSVMAIQTEDLGVRRGDGFELIGRGGQAEARGCSLMAVANASGGAEG